MSRSPAYDQRNDAMREGFKSPIDFAAAAPSTAETISTTAQQLGLEHNVESLPGSGSPARIHWLGDRKADKVLLYFHGGGFAIPILAGHVKFLSQSMEKLQKNGKKLCIALLEYTLTPKAVYPTQLIQSCEALRLVLSSGFDASKVIIGGDSAGGNLTLAVLSVISHGFPNVERLNLNGKLAGALLVSPWTSFSTASESYKLNVGKDVVSLETLPPLVNAYRKQDEHDEYSEPGSAKKDWWNNSPVESILTVYGGAEVLRDAIAQMTKTLTESGNSVKAVECAKQVHIDNVLDAHTDMEPGQMSEEIWQWLGQVV